MKKFIVFAAFLIALSSASFAQTKPTKQPRKSNAEKLREKEEAERQLKEMGIDSEVEEEPETKVKKTPPRRTPPKKRGAKEVEEVKEPSSPILTTYYDLPLESIPQVKNYIDEKEDVDSKSIRRGFIRNHLPNNNFLHLQLPADDKFTRIQQFQTEDKKNVVAIQTSICTQGTCHNTLKFYMLENEDWTEVTEKYMPELDKKYILSKIKSKYKKEYLDLDLYNSKGYETDEEFFDKSIVSTIDGDQNKIIIREQYLPLPLYEMVWDGKSKFVLKKL